MMNTTGSSGSIPSSSGEPRCLRILCVDDNPYFLNAVSHFFSDCGHQTTHATNVHEALSLIHESGLLFDAVIIEDSFCDVGGIHWVSALRASRYRGRMVVKSSELSMAQREAYKNLGVHAMVERPVDLHELLRCIQPDAVG
jgi:CheY-like chemotaxis protein